MSRNDLTADRLDELLALAERAQPGPWVVTDLRDYGHRTLWVGRSFEKPAKDGSCVTNTIVSIEEDMPAEVIWGKGDADFIAACDPDTIRQLIAMARRGMELERQMEDATYEQRTRES